jgi:signal transduction histidine kinase
VVLLSDGVGYYNLAPFTAFIKDAQGELDITDILTQESFSNTQAIPFTPSTSRSFNRGLDSSVFWLRFSLRNQQSEQQNWRLEIGPSSVDLLEVYLPRPDGRIDFWETGDQQPFSQREMAYRGFVFTLQVSPGAEQVVYIRFQNKGQSRLNLSLWSEPGFAAFQTREQFFLGLFYGSLVIVWNYSLLLLLSLRQRVAWHFDMLLVALLATFLLFISDGLAYWLIWPKATWLNDAALLTFWALTAAAIMHLALRYAQVEHGKVPYRFLLQSTTALWVGLALLNLFLNSPGLARSIHLLTLPSMLLLILVGWKILPSVSLPQRSLLALIALLVILNLPFTLTYLIPGFYWLDPLLGSRLLTLVFLVMVSFTIRHRYELLALRQLEAEQAAARAAAENERLIRHHSNRLATQVEQLSRELTALLDLTVLVADERNWEDILTPVLSSVRQAGRLDAVIIHQFTPSSGRLTLLAHLGFQPKNLEHLAALTLSLPSADAPLFNATSVELPALGLPGFAHHISLVLRVRGVPLGLLTAYRQTGPPFLPDQVAVLAAFAAYISVKIENQRLRLEGERFVVDQERQRMARDLHDSLNQSIYSLALLARAGRDAHEDGEIERVKDNLALLEEYAHLALREMRLLLFQLRPPELEALGLVGALQSRFDLVERRTGLQAEVHAPPDLRLPSVVEIELYRICIEALNNCLKHAQASQVIVRFSIESRNLLKMSIEDDGIGFDPQAISPGMGLKNMNTRAEQIHAQLALETTPGAGVRLSLSTRLPPQEI